MTIEPAEPIIHFMSERRVILDWMDEVLSDKGWNPKNWADATTKPKIAATTITRFIRHEDASIPSTRTLFKLAAAARVDPPGTGQSTKKTQRNSRPGATTEEVEVVGSVQAGAWRETLEWPPDERYVIQVNIDPRYPIARYTGLEVRGTSMNKTYTEGTVLVCISAIEQRVEPKSGEIVIVRRRNRNGEFEHTVKELEILDDGQHLLWPRSDDPAYTEALEWHPGDVNEQDDLLVTGIVIRAV